MVQKIISAYLTVAIKNSSNLSKQELDLDTAQSAEIGWSCNVLGSGSVPLPAFYTLGHYVPKRGGSLGENVIHSLNKQMIDYIICL